MLVCGGPGSGKTTLAGALGAALHLPVVVRDQLKTGYDATHPGLDWASDEVRRVDGSRVFDVFHRVIDAHVDGGVAVVAEASWVWRFAAANLAPRFARSDAVVLHVSVPAEVSAARYRARFEAGERHAAHRDDVFAATVDSGAFPWDDYVPPADLPVPVHRLDGTLPRPELLATAVEALNL